MSNATRDVLRVSAGVAIGVGALLIARFFGSIGIALIAAAVIVGVELFDWSARETVASSVGENMKASLILLGCMLPAIVLVVYLVLPDDVEDWFRSDGFVWFAILYPVLVGLLLVGSWINRTKA